MGLDTWFETDIQSFLEHEVTEQAAPQVVRLEDTASAYANLDWRKEIRARISQGDVDGAKQLFSQLRLKYTSTPKEHPQERASLYETMKDCYVIIANRVLDDMHTRAILEHMDGGSDNIFDDQVKPVDLSRPFTQQRSIVPDVPQLTKSNIAAFPSFQSASGSDPLAMPEPDEDQFSFEPKRIIHTAEAATVRTQSAQSGRPAPAAAPAAPIMSAERAVSILHQAMTLAVQDPHKAHDLLTSLTTAEAPESIRKQAMTLIAALAPHIDPAEFMREAERSLVDLTTRVRSRESGLEDKLDMLRARLTEFARVNPDHAIRAHRLLDRLAAVAVSLDRIPKPEVPVQTTPPQTELEKSLLPVAPAQPSIPKPVAAPPPMPEHHGITSNDTNEADLARARATVTAYTGAMRFVDDELIKASAFARARNRTEAELALLRAAVVVDTLTTTHPDVARPLRERVERTARTFSIAAPIVGKAAATLEKAITVAAPQHLAPRPILKPVSAPQPVAALNTNLAAARETAALHANATKLVDDELVKAGSLARSRDRAGAELALARAAAVVDSLATTHPATARPLRERLERTARIFSLAVPALGAGVTTAKALTPSPHAPVTPHRESQLLVVARRVRLAAAAHDAAGFSTALAALEGVARGLPASQRILLTDTITALRMRAQTSTTGGQA